MSTSWGEMNGWLNEALRDNRLEIARWPEWKRRMAGKSEPDWSQFEICECCGYVVGYKRKAKP